MKAIWNGQVLAESNETRIVEGNHYFPPQSIKCEFFKKSDLKTTCAWKGQAGYYNLEVEGKTNENAAWFYPETSGSANHIKGYIAFWKGVTVEE